MPRSGRLTLVLALLALCLPAAASAQAPYSVPADNPFVGQAGAAPEIYSLGLRNPFRFSFDRANGALTIGDVGQGAREEINFVAAGGARGGNFQWACREGLIAGPKTCPPLANSIAPVFDYAEPGRRAARRSPAAWSSATRGCRASWAATSTRTSSSCPIRTISLPAANDDREEAPDIGSTVAFGEDAAGGVYAVSLAGDVWRLGEGAGGAMTATLVTSVNEPMNLSRASG